MPSNITFPVDGDQVLPAFQPTLNAVALVVKKYEKTTVDVAGHTDSSGDDAYNQALSERRALAVANYIYGQGIDGRRFAVQGFGETQPIASNKNEAGRAQNRRVEIKLAPLT
jgi:outer membrane protein OmpA-like peptidoglycan-associated protein